jgi:hypothetical protein
MTNAGLLIKEVRCFDSEDANDLSYARFTSSITTLALVVSEASSGLLMTSRKGRLRGPIR